MTIPTGQQSLREYIENLRQEGYYVVGGQTGDPDLVDPMGNPVTTWQEGYPYDTRIDAEEIRSTGAPVVQINTGAGCHLDADMLARGLAELRPADGSLVFIENVGNLVCPALFDLGEAARVVVVSVTEGEDKPLKYPYMFSLADVVVINKIDLLPYVDVRLDRLTGHCQEVNAGVRVLPLSVTTGEGDCGVV